MQIYTLGSNAPLLPPQSVEDSFVLSIYNVTGAGPFDLLPNNRAGRVLAVEPGTLGVMYVDTLRLQKTPGTQTPVSNVFQNAVVYFNCSRSGVLSISTATPTYGALATPETPAAMPSRANFVSYTAVSRSGVNPPYIRILASGNANTSNFISNVRVVTSSYDGA